MIDRDSHYVHVGDTIIDYKEEGIEVCSTINDLDRLSVGDIFHYEGNFNEYIGRKGKLHLYIKLEAALSVRPTLKIKPSFLVHTPSRMCISPENLNTGSIICPYKGSTVMVVVDRVVDGIIEGHTLDPDSRVNSEYLSDEIWVTKSYQCD